MEQQEPARARPIVVVARLAGPVTALAGFVFLTVVTVLHPERFDGFGFPLALTFALAYAVRRVLLVPRMRRRVDR